MVEYRWRIERLGDDGGSSGRVNRRRVVLKRKGLKRRRPRLPAEREGGEWSGSNPGVKSENGRRTGSFRFRRFTAAILWMEGE